MSWFKPRSTPISESEMGSDAPPGVGERIVPEARDEYLSAPVSEFAMDDMVDRILNTYQLMRPLDPDRVSNFKTKNHAIHRKLLRRQSDAEQLAVYGLAYLKELPEGQDPRFTGC